MGNTLFDACQRPTNTAPQGNLQDQNNLTLFDVCQNPSNTDSHTNNEGLEEANPGNANVDGNELITTLGRPPNHANGGQPERDSRITGFRSGFPRNAPDTRDPRSNSNTGYVRYNYSRNRNKNQNGRFNRNSDRGCHTILEEDDHSASDHQTPRIRGIQRTQRNQPSRQRPARQVQQKHFPHSGFGKNQENQDSRGAKFERKRAKVGGGLRKATNSDSRCNRWRKAKSLQWKGRDRNPNGIPNNRNSDYFWHGDINIVDGRAQNRNSDRKHDRNGYCENQQSISGCQRGRSRRGGRHGNRSGRDSDFDPEFQGSRGGRHEYDFCDSASNSNSPLPNEQDVVFSPDSYVDERGQFGHYSLFEKVQQRQGLELEEQKQRQRRGKRPGKRGRGSTSKRRKQRCTGRNQRNWNPDLDLDPDYMTQSFSHSRGGRPKTISDFVLRKSVFHNSDMDVIIQNQNRRSRRNGPRHRYSHSRSNRRRNDRRNSRNDPEENDIDIVNVNRFPESEHEYEVDGTDNTSSLISDDRRVFFVFENNENQQSHESGRGVHSFDYSDRSGNSDKWSDFRMDDRFFERQERDEQAREYYQGCDQWNGRPKRGQEQTETFSGNQQQYRDPDADPDPDVREVRQRLAECLHSERDSEQRMRQINLFGPDNDRIGNPYPVPNDQNDHDNHNRNDSKIVLEETSRNGQRQHTDTPSKRTRKRKRENSKAEKRAQKRAERRRRKKRRKMLDYQEMQQEFKQYIICQKTGDIPGGNSWERLFLARFARSRLEDFWFHLNENLRFVADFTKLQHYPSIPDPYYRGPNWHSDLEDIVDPNRNRGAEFPSNFNLHSNTALQSPNVSNSMRSRGGRDGDKVQHRPKHKSFGRFRNPVIYQMQLRAQMQANELNLRHQFVNCDTQHLNLQGTDYFDNFDSSTPGLALTTPGLYGTPGNGQARSSSSEEEEIWNTHDNVKDSDSSLDVDEVDGHPNDVRNQRSKRSETRKMQFVNKKFLTASPEKKRGHDIESNSRSGQKVAKHRSSKKMRFQRSPDKFNGRFSGNGKNVNRPFGSPGGLLSPLNLMDAMDSRLDNLYFNNLSSNLDNSFQPQSSSYNLNNESYFNNSRNRYNGGGGNNGGNRGDRNDRSRGNANRRGNPRGIGRHQEGNHQHHQHSHEHHRRQHCHETAPHKYWAGYSQVHVSSDDEGRSGSRNFSSLRSDEMLYCGYAGASVEGTLQFIFSHWMTEQKVLELYAVIKKELGREKREKKLMRKGAREYILREEEQRAPKSGARKRPSSNTLHIQRGYCRHRGRSGKPRKGEPKMRFQYPITIKTNRPLNFDRMPGMLPLRKNKPQRPKKRVPVVKSKVEMEMQDKMQETQNQAVDTEQKQSVAKMQNPNPKKRKRPGNILIHTKTARERSRLRALARARKRRNAVPLLELPTSQNCDLDPDPSKPKPVSARQRNRRNRNRNRRTKKERQNGGQTQNREAEVGIEVEESFLATQQEEQKLEKTQEPQQSRQSRLLRKTMVHPWMQKRRERHREGSLGGNWKGEDRATFWRQLRNQQQPHDFSHRPEKIEREMGMGPRLPNMNTIPIRSMQIPIREIDEFEDEFQASDSISISNPGNENDHDNEHDIPFYHHFESGDRFDTMYDFQSSDLGGLVSNVNMNSNSRRSHKGRRPDRDLQYPEIQGHRGSPGHRVRRGNGQQYSYDNGGGGEMDSGNIVSVSPRIQPRAFLRGNTVAVTTGSRDPTVGGNIEAVQYQYAKHGKSIATTFARTTTLGFGPRTGTLSGTTRDYSGSTTVTGVTRIGNIGARTFNTNPNNRTGILENENIEKIGKNKLDKTDSNPYANSIIFDTEFSSILPKPKHRQGTRNDSVIFQKKVQVKKSQENQRSIDGEVTGHYQETQIQNPHTQHQDTQQQHQLQMDHKPISNQKPCQIQGIVQKPVPEQDVLPQKLQNISTSPDEGTTFLQLQEKETTKAGARAGPTKIEEFLGVEGYEREFAKLRVKASGDETVKGGMKAETRRNETIVPQVQETDSKHAKLEADLGRSKTATTNLRNPQRGVTEFEFHLPPSAQVLVPAPVTIPPGQHQRRRWFSAAATFLTLRHGNTSSLNTNHNAHQPRTASSLFPAQNQNIST